MPVKFPKGTQVFERGDKVFMVAPVSPLTVTDEQIEEFAFADSVKRMRSQAPNPNLAWFGGHYVEADAANRNGAMWTAGELAIKAVTPMFMPVTVMHDPRTAVGLIADTVLKTPDQHQVPRSRIETALALWAHRFPEAVEEAMHNYKAGTLMQSMECLAPEYSCSTCGMTYQKLPRGAERANWCSHLLESNPSGGYTARAGESPTAVRILRQVCFTGTGLIYGTRGARGADPHANLEAFQEEVAEYHERSHRTDTRKPRRTRTSMDPIEVAKSEYEALLKRPEQKTLDAAIERAEAAEAKVATLEEEKAAAEKAKADAEEAKEAAEKKVSDAEEKAAAADLKTKRLDALGEGFKAKLGAKTKERLTEQAGTMKDPEWEARLEELAEAYGVKPDEAKASTEADGDETVFTRDEVARSKTAGASEEEHASAQPSEAAQKNVVGGLFSMARAGKL
ncbi:MAG: hypothetical protein QOF36_2546 [Microbacteriaceae bacterium]|jgi:hypothetical protein|nr:hypothetical protein [Microbacteriaceae bacterium]